MHDIKRRRTELETQAKGAPAPRESYKISNYFRTEERRRTTRTEENKEEKRKY
jgi:hypothetical protein